MQSKTQNSVNLQNYLLSKYNTTPQHSAPHESESDIITIGSSSDGLSGETVMIKSDSDL